MPDADMRNEMAMQLELARDAVVDEASFIHFVNLLSRDWFAENELHAISPQAPFSAGASGWENGNIGAFLEASASWAESSKNGLRFYDVPSNNWRRFADILFMGKIYE